MKKLTILGAFLIASVVLTSCGPSACDCAELSMEAIKETMANLDDPIKTAEKWEKKMKPCVEASEGDEEFEKEVEKCLEDIIKEEK